MAELRPHGITLSSRRYQAWSTHANDSAPMPACTQNIILFKPRELRIDTAPIACAGSPASNTESRGKLAWEWSAVLKWMGKNPYGFANLNFSREIISISGLFRGHRDMSCYVEHGRTTHFVVRQVPVLHSQPDIRRQTYGEPEAVSDGDNIPRRLLPSHHVCVCAD